MVEKIIGGYRYFSLSVAMDIGKTFYALGRNDWRKWFEANFDKEREIRLIYPSEGSGKAIKKNKTKSEQNRRIGFGGIEKYY